MNKKHGGNIYDFAKKYKIDESAVIDFSANINPQGLSSKIKEALNNESAILNYPDPDYTALKDKISAFENVNKEYVVLGNGGIECLFLLAEALKGKTVTIVVPTFIEYERAFSKFGHIKFFYLDEDFTLDVDRLITESESSDAIMICNPNNPTGHLIKKEKIESILEKSNQLVIVDEAFIDFTDDEKNNTLVKVVSSNDRLIVLKSLTKFFAIPGLRLGYLLTSNVLIREYIQTNRMPWSINGIAAKIGEIILEDEMYIKTTKEWIVKERLWFVNVLKSLNLKVFETQGNYVFFKATVGLDLELAKHCIMIRNCSNYEGLSDGYYRVAIKERKLNQILVDKLKEILWK